MASGTDLPGSNAMTLTDDLTRILGAALSDVTGNELGEALASALSNATKDAFFDPRAALGVLEHVESHIEAVADGLRDDVDLMDDEEG